jgi:hypothetical protein
MEELIDIEGLAKVGLWPLALGWWFLIVILTVILIAASFFWYKNYKYRLSWQHKSFKNLKKMQKQLENNEFKLVLQNFSIEMRKIAMLTTKREVCAGLIGKQWLQWLQKHDPKGFNWEANGNALIASQYMPETLSNNIEEINKLIDAAKNWVHKC